MKDKILNILKDKPLKVDEIKDLLKIKNSNDFIVLNKTINELINIGLCFEIKGKIYLTSNYEIGVVDVYKSHVYIDDKELKYDSNLFLFSGDTVIYKENKYDCTLIKILERKTTYVFGTVVIRKNKPYFFSDDIRLKDFKVVNFNEYKKDIRPNYKIRTFICDYNKKLLKIDKVIGNNDDEDTLINTILLKNDAPNPFSNKVLKEVANLDKTIKLDNRKDLRDLSFITIDGDDAKDFDDAIYVEANDEGYKLYVSIADVSHYVTEHTALNKEAYKRGTSIYYPGHVIPMLPFELSDDLCSLIEGSDRYTLTCEMSIGFDGVVNSYDIYPSLINSKHRMTYSNVNKMLEHDQTLLSKYSDIKNMIFTSYSLSRIVDKLRKSKGGIEFESNEPIIIEEDGKVVDIKLRVQGKAELMIEDFMILANETVASHMYYLGLPMIYRNHDYPKVDRIEKFIKIANELGYTFKGDIYKLESSSLQKCLSHFENTDEYSLISDTMLRCMSKALYSHNCNGHYGLGIDYYCHFTSPIRRYPDLIVHRMLKKYVFNTDNINDIDIDNINNEELANQSNKREKVATTIERNIIDLKKCEFMQDKINEKFIGTISSITNFGIYVRLDNTIEGLVHIKTLDGYYYLDDNDNLTDGSNIFRIGQKVKVKLTNIDLDNRNIDFILV